MHRNFRKPIKKDLSSLALGNEWDEGWVNCAFGIIWTAYDRLDGYLKGKRIDPATLTEDQISHNLIRFTQIVSGYSPAKFRLDFVPQPPDTSIPRVRKGNTNDIGVFFGDEIEKASFVFEAKKIEIVSASGIKSYLEDLDAYLIGYYAAHLSESGLIAYLLRGDSEALIKTISKCLCTKLSPVAGYVDRSHATSDHKKANRERFRCHHLVFDLQY